MDRCRGCGLRAYSLRSALLLAFQCILSASNSTFVGHFTRCVKLVDLGNLNLVFMGMWGHAEHVVCVQTYFWLYIYLHMCGYAANPCVAGCRCLVLCLFVSLVGFGFWLKMN